MPLRDGFFSTATQTSCCNRIQRSNRVRLLVVSTHDFPDICIYAWSSHLARVWIKQVRLPVLHVVSSCLRIWSRQTGSAVPSRVSLLMSILRLNLVLTYGIPPEFRGGMM